jgi:acetyltransferase (GNAT) family protein
MNEVLWSLLPADLAAKRKMALFRVGGAWVAMQPGSISLQRNRVLGLGVEERASEETVDQILDLFRAFRVRRFSLHLSPGAQSDSIAAWLKKRGFALHHRYSKLFRDTSPPQPAPIDLRVARIGKSEARAFAAVVSEIFAWPPDSIPWIAAAVGVPGFSHYAAFDGDRVVATALLYVAGEVGWLGWGGTLTPYRRRGVHAALIAARLRRAAELGARWVTCATMEPQRGRPSGSYRGLLKQGFQQAYLRPIWVWE